MAADLTAVRVAVSGAVFKGASGVPTGTGTAPTGAVDLGLIGEDGTEIEIPGEGDSTPIKQWDGSVVRTIRMPSEDSPTWKVTFLESNKDVVETTFGVTITAAAADGSFEYTVTNRDHDNYTFDYIDGSVLTRDYVPYAIVTDVDAMQMNNSDAVKYTLTFTGEIDPTLGYNFKRWSTAWKTA